MGGAAKERLHGWVTIVFRKQRRSTRPHSSMSKGTRVRSLAHWECLEGSFPPAHAYPGACSDLCPALVETQWLRVNFCPERQGCPEWQARLKTREADRSLVLPYWSDELSEMLLVQLVGQLKRRSEVISPMFRWMEGRNQVMSQLKIYQFWSLCNRYYCWFQREQNHHVLWDQGVFLESIPPFIPFPSILYQFISPLPPKCYPPLSMYVPFSTSLSFQATISFQLDNCNKWILYSTINQITMFPSATPPKDFSSHSE